MHLSACVRSIDVATCHEFADMELQIDPNKNGPVLGPMFGDMSPHCLKSTCILLETGHVGGHLRRGLQETKDRYWLVPALLRPFIYGPLFRPPRTPIPTNDSLRGRPARVLAVAKLRP